MKINEKKVIDWILVILFSIAVFSVLSFTFMQQRHANEINDLQKQRIKSIDSLKAN